MKKSFTNVEALTQNRELTLAVIFSGLIFFVPALVHQQFLVGPIVNALLILSLLNLGKSRAFFLALIPSSVALANGLLPLALAPMVPFIMISNCLYIATFAKFYQSETSLTKNLPAVFLAALVKSLFLFLLAKLVMEGLLIAPLSTRIASMMSWPQLWTATVGGVLAILIQKNLEKNYAARR
jgi:hypothetical protein